MDEPTINVDLLFGSVETRDLPPRWEGNKMTYRYRIISRDRYGNITKDEAHDGCSLVWGAEPRPSFWQRLKTVLC